MNLLKKLSKRRKCKHEYHIIDSQYYSGKYHHIIYCPKCDKEKCVSAIIYDREKIKKKLKEKFKGKS